MNCEGFKDVMYEYLDGSLAAGVQTAAREHLRQCGACRHAVRREQAVTQKIRASLQRATNGLSLRAGTLPRLLRAWEAEQVPPNLLLRAWQWFISSSMRPIGAGAVLLVALVVLLRLPNQREPAEAPKPAAAAETSGETRVVDVPLQTQTRLFRRQDNTVLDTVASSVALAYARFPDNRP